MWFGWEKIFGTSDLNILLYYTNWIIFRNALMSNISSSYFSKWAIFYITRTWRIWGFYAPCNEDPTIFGAGESGHTQVEYNFQLHLPVLRFTVISVHRLLENVAWAETDHGFICFMVSHVIFSPVVVALFHDWWSCCWERLEQVGRSSVPFCRTVLWQKLQALLPDTGQGTCMRKNTPFTSCSLLLIDDAKYNGKAKSWL